MAKHIALVGMMGSGKSSVAPIVAGRLARPVVEVDAALEEQESMAVSEIFLAKGEAYFRRLERQYIEQLLARPPAVLSLGGGAFMAEPTRTLLLRETIVFYLVAGAETLLARLDGQAVAARPLLQKAPIDLPATLLEIFSRRQPYYELAPFHVPTDGRTIEQVAEAILRERHAYL